MIKQRRILILFIVIGLLFLGAGVTIFLFQQNFTSPANNILNSQLNEIDIETNEIEINKIDGMKLYRNEEWGFEFKYPNQMIIQEKSFRGYYSKFNLYIRDKVDKGLEQAFLVNIVLPEFAERSFSGLDKKTNEIVVDGVPGVEYEYELNERREKVAIFPFGDFRLILGIHYEEYEDLYKQILSTFKFLK